MTTRDLDRLAKHVKAHRLELYPSRLVAAKTAGISKDTWKRAETGQPVQDKKYAQIDRALGWATGSCIAIAEGAEAVPAKVVGTGDDATMVSSPPAEWAGANAEDVVRQAIGNGALVTVPGLPIGEVHALTDEVVQILRKHGLLPGVE